MTIRYELANKSFSPTEFSQDYPHIVPSVWAINSSFLASIWCVCRNRSIEPRSETAHVYNHVQHCRAISSRRGHPAGLSVESAKGASVPIVGREPWMRSSGGTQSALWVYRASPDSIHVEREAHSKHYSHLTGIPPTHPHQQVLAELLGDSFRVGCFVMLNICNARKIE